MFEILKTMDDKELRKKAIDDLIEEQNKVIKQCQDGFDLRVIELEKIKIISEITGDLLNGKEEIENLSNNICELKAKAKRAIELKVELEKMKGA